MTASEPERSASRWPRRRHGSASTEAPVDIAVVRAADDEPAPSEPEVPPVRPASTRPTAKTFVLDNARILAAILLLIIGVVLVILGWYGAAYTNVLTEQIPYLISGGLLGAALIIVAGFLASSASLERESRELRRDLVRAISSIRGSTPGVGFETDSAAPVEDGSVLVVAGGHSYHFAGCPIVEGKSARAITIREALKSGLGMCRLCGPE